MGKTIISGDAFPEIIAQYNNGGTTEAYDFLRSRYEIKHPYFVLAWVKFQRKSGLILLDNQKHTKFIVL